MPKLKTRKTAAKRFKLTSTGKILRRKATRAHKLIGKAAKRKRAYTQEYSIDATNVKTVKKMLGIN